MAEITAHFPNFDPEFFVDQTQKIQEIINDNRFESWQEIWNLSQSCKQEYDASINCVDQIKAIDLQAIIENNGKDFDGLRHELSKGFIIVSWKIHKFNSFYLVECLNDVKIDSCVALKTEIIEQPDFEIFYKVQEIFFNARNFIFKVTNNLETKIDKIESLYLSR